MPHSHIRLYYHLVWCTHAREPLLVGPTERSAYALIRSLTEKHGVTVIAVGGMPDHVHLLVQAPQTVSIADLMEKVKGASSRALSQELAAVGSVFAWGRGYGATTVSPAAVPSVEGYILNQRRHHTDGKLWPKAERVEDD